MSCCTRGLVGLLQIVSSVSGSGPGRSSWPGRTAGLLCVVHMLKQVELGPLPCAEEFQGPLGPQEVPRVAGMGMGHQLLSSLCPHRGSAPRTPGWPRTLRLLLRPHHRNPACPWAVPPSGAAPGGSTRGRRLDVLVSVPFLLEAGYVGTAPQLKPLLPGVAFQDVLDRRCSLPHHVLPRSLPSAVQRGRPSGVVFSFWGPGALFL